LLSRTIFGDVDNFQRVTIDKQNGGSRGRPARFGTLRLGDRDIDGIAGDLFIGNKGAFANPDWSGNLGGGVLRRFTLALDHAFDLWQVAEIGHCKYGVGECGGPDAHLLSTSKADIGELLA
jgi:hypothetical protein